MATAKQPPNAIKCVAYENSSPWCMLKLKTVQKSPLYVCNMLIYTVQVWIIVMEILAQWCQKSDAIQVHFVFGLVSHSSSFNLGVYWLSWQHSCRSIARNVLKCTTSMYYLTVSMATSSRKMCRIWKQFTTVYIEI